MANEESNVLKVIDGIFSTFLIIFSGLISFGNLYVIKLHSIVDGDTVVFYWPFLPRRLRRISLRIEGIDTAEKNGVSPRERALSKKARERVERLMFFKISIVRFTKWGKYGGRAIGNVWSIFGTNIGKRLLKERLAISYDGSSKSYNWARHKE